MAITTGKDELTTKEIHCDVLIIGSGAGGSRAADYLTKAGYSTTIIEEGPFVTYKDFDQDESKLVPLMYRRSAGLATDNFGIKILQGKVWGGSTTINWMTSLRTPDWVLEQWVEEFGLEDYTTEKMENHFEKVEKRLNVHKVDKRDYNRQNQIIHDGCTELGIHTDSLNNNSKDCIGCGSCGLGCYYDAKQDMRLTYLKDALEQGLHAFTDTKAISIDYQGSNQQLVKAKVGGKQYGNSDQILRFKTKNTVVSAGAIYTPLLLQKSGLTKSKTLGKYFQIHPVTASYAQFDFEVHPSYGIPQTAYSKEYIDYDGNGYGWWLEVPDIEPFLAGVNYPAIGKDRHEGMKNLSKSGIIIIIVRDGANKKSNGEIKWRRGINLQSGSFSLNKLPSIRYSICKEDKHHLLKGLQNALEVHFAAGAKKVLTLHNKDNVFTSKSEIDRVLKLPNGPNELTYFSAHPMGTARMGIDPSISVIGPDLQMHHYPGIYVMDGSIMPTALGVNPMITILSTVGRGLELGDW